MPDATVVVDGDRIAAVGGGAATPAGADIIDGRGKTLLPGLIDAHVHVYRDGVLEQALAFGVTTVLDMFASTQIFALRQDPRPGRADLRSAGILATAPHGHGTEYGFPIPTLTAPGEAQAWVDARIAEGSDYIKIVFDDGRAYHMPIPTLDTPTFLAVVDAAHLRNKLAVVHIGDYDHARLAIDGGADGLVHTFRDRMPAADFGADVAAHHAFVTPTLSMVQSMYGTASRLPADPDVMALLPPVAAATLIGHRPPGLVGADAAPAATIAQLRDAGATILCGTDAPNPGTAFGASMHEELALLVEAGLSPIAALSAATSAPAARFGLADRGRIAAGMRADLLLIDGDPTTDIAASRRIAGIWHVGQRFDREGYRRRIAEVNAAAAARVSASALGLVSDFETDATSRLGSAWTAFPPGTTGAVAKVAGLRGSRGALEIRGEVPAAPAPGTMPMLRDAGAVWTPGIEAWLPTDLSAVPGIAFVARGDGGRYQVMLYTLHDGIVPHVQSFTARRTPSTVRFTWRDFDSDGKDIVGVVIGRRDAAGRFTLVIDDVTLQ